MFEANFFSFVQKIQITTRFKNVLDCQTLYMYFFHSYVCSYIATHLVTHRVWPHPPENPPGSLGLSGLVHEEAHPSFPYSA